MPVTRAISRCPLPSASSVWMVVCLFGFKTFNSATSTRSGGQFTSCPKGAGGAGLTTLSRSAQVEEFEVAMGGGIWVAVRGGDRKPLRNPPDLDANLSELRFELSHLQHWMPARFALRRCLTTSYTWESLSKEALLGHSHSL